ncbi:hypothetical protein ACGFZB_28675 [Streptomyces cinerochromogenes]|uniref:Uncharacterized protein n=1 Tax=Streptomyces cinerochromogenes TaxID=66422 RepID=A0ABW7BAU2_9ACTN
MSAWAELVNANGSDEWLELCSRALEEVQRETSRRNAAKIRAASVTGDTNWDAITWTRGMKHGADLIDPEAP